jgi:hypothetical protein
MILVYLYFFMNICIGLCQLPFIIILFLLTTWWIHLLPTYYQVDLFHGYCHFTFIIPLDTSLGIPYYSPYLHYVPFPFACFIFKT